MGNVCATQWSPHSSTGSEPNGPPAGSSFCTRHFGLMGMRSSSNATPASTSAWRIAWARPRQSKYRKTTRGAGEVMRGGWGRAARAASRASAGSATIARTMPTATPADDARWRDAAATLGLDLVDSKDRKVAEERGRRRHEMRGRVDDRFVRVRYGLQSDADGIT